MNAAGGQRAKAAGESEVGRGPGFQSPVGDGMESEFSSKFSEKLFRDFKWSRDR